MNFYLVEVSQAGWVIIIDYRDVYGMWSRVTYGPMTARDTHNDLHLQHELFQSHRAPFGVYTIDLRNTRRLYHYRAQ